MRLQRHTGKLSRFGMAIGLLAGVLVASQGRAETEEEMLWDRVAYGTTEKELQTLYPHVLPSEHNADAPTIGGPGVLRFTDFSLEGARFGDLEPCRVEFLFFQSRILQIDFYCDVVRDKIYAELEKQFGMPRRANAEETGEIAWQGGRRGVSYIPRTGAFGISDALRNARAVEAVLEAETLAVKRLYAPDPPDGKGESPSDSASD